MRSQEQELRSHDRTPPLGPNTELDQGRCNKSCKPTLHDEQQTP